MLTSVVRDLLLRRADRQDIKHLQVLALPEPGQEPVGLSHLLCERLHAGHLRLVSSVAGKYEDLEAGI